jgi:hypothetical protein
MIGVGSVGVRMRGRRQQSIPFGLVFAGLTSLGAIGGVATGLYANSMRTGSELPAEESQHFEYIQSASAPSEATSSIPARQDVAAAPSESLEDAALFSPVPAYPARVAYALASVHDEPAAAAPEVNPAPQEAAAAKPAVQTPAARHSSGRPGGVLNDAQIASIKKRLNLTPDQERLWPAVETALRNVTYSRKAREIKVASVHNGPMAYVDPDSAEIQQLKYAALPLIMRLNDDQKQEVKSLAYVMGLEGVASGF